MMKQVMVMVLAWQTVCFQIPSRPTKRQHLNPDGPGPNRTTVKAKFYHLPDAARIPRFSANRNGEFDPIFIDHMENGYGKIFKSSCCKITESQYFSV